tara:strand:- start:2268 stop:2492 length:225 start_codon:yes stop_codon:yes gene_type:complete
MRDDIVVLTGSSIVYVYESVSLETLRQIVEDLEDPGFGSDHIQAVRLASRILYRRELEAVKDLDTIVSDIEPCI